MTDAIALFASARRDGNTGKLMDWVARELNIEVVDLAQKHISPYDYEHRNIGDDFVPLMNQVLKYDKIIFATPVYWYAASAQMKIFIDRISDLLAVESLKNLGRQLREKTGYVVCSSIGEQADQPFIAGFISTFDYLGMDFGGYLHANCKEGYRAANYTAQVKTFVKMVEGR